MLNLLKSNRRSIVMDYTKMYTGIKQMAQLYGVNEIYLERHETLYYDESGNIKHLIVKNKSLNADVDSVFVLGGIQAEDGISISELKKLLNKKETLELKANRDFRGDFGTILRKDIFRNILNLILHRNWHIHFCIVQVLYYAFVDIIDSIKGLDDNIFLYKYLFLY